VTAAAGLPVALPNITSQQLRNTKKKHSKMFKKVQHMDSGDDSFSMGLCGKATLLQHS